MSPQHQPPEAERRNQEPECAHIEIPDLFFQTAERNCCDQQGKQVKNEIESEEKVISS